MVGSFLNLMMFRSSYIPVTTESLLAVRMAGASFTGPYNLRSETFEQLAREYDALGLQITDLKDKLVQELYTSVPEAASAAERHALLQIRREVFNLAVPGRKQPVSARNRSRTCVNSVIYCALVKSCSMRIGPGSFRNFAGNCKLYARTKSSAAR